MKKYLLILLLLIPFVSGYTAPTSGNVEIQIGPDYIAPTSGDVELQIGSPIFVPPVDTCSPSSPLTANYAFDCADNCNIVDLDVGGFTLETYGTGSLTLTSSVTNYGMFKLRGNEPNDRCIIKCIGCVK